MERYAWKAKVKKGMLGEYKRRHDNIWDEMKQMLKSAGITNYSIWSDGENLFGYYECKDGIEKAASVQAQSEITKRWDEYMSDILIMEKDEKTGAQPLLEEVFRFE